MAPAAMPEKMADVLSRFGQDLSASPALADAAKWGGLQPGTPIVKGDALFPRADATEEPPSPVEQPVGAS